MNWNAKILPSILVSLFQLSAIFPARAQDPSANALKPNMFQFLAMSADLRVEGIKSEKPDWAAIRETLRKMKENARVMGSISPGSGYHPYLEELSASLREMETLSRREDKRISRAFDDLTRSCLRCHRTHLPEYRFQEPPR